MARGQYTLEYDGLTGQWQTSGKTFPQYMRKLIDPDFLFDVGVEAVDLLVPGAVSPSS